MNSQTNFIIRLRIVWQRMNFKHIVTRRQTGISYHIARGTRPHLIKSVQLIFKSTMLSVAVIESSKLYRQIVFLIIKPYRRCHAKNPLQYSGVITRNDFFIQHKQTVELQITFS